VDVGAGVGDTAVLFSLRGAERVIALEPCPRLYGEASLNIKANGLVDRVVLVNAGLGALDGEVCADLSDVEGYSVFRPGGRCDVKVRISTLRTLIKEFEIEEGSALKMDCEGCEYEAVLNADPSDHTVFGQVIIEYHNGYREIKKYIETAGFSTEIKPIRSAAIPIERLGYVVARRKLPISGSLTTCSQHFGSPLDCRPRQTFAGPQQRLQSQRTSATGHICPVGLPPIAKNRLKAQTPPPQRAVPVRIRKIYL